MDSNCLEMGIAFDLYFLVFVADFADLSDSDDGGRETYTF